MRVTSDEQAIANLLAGYADRIDAGDFEGLGAMFATGTVRFPDSGDAYTGADEVGRMYAGVVQLHDGSPLTKHVMTNTMIEVDDGGRRATARSYFTVFQAHPELPLQPVATGRYEDELELVDGRWRFAERTIVRDLVGDLRFHLVRDPYEVAGR